MHLPSAVFDRVKICSSLRACIALALLGGAFNAFAGDEPEFAPVDSVAWQARFEDWVETHLLREQMVEAAGTLPEVDPNAALAILEELEREHVHAWRESPALPSDALPRLLARGADGRALESVRAYAKGNTGLALDLLRFPKDHERGMLLHLRAQMLDEQTREFHPIFRLASIDAYREAIRSDPNAPQSARARLRIGQIYLEIGFLVEARAQLSTLQDPLPPRPFGVPARVSFAEVSYLVDDPNTASAVLLGLDPNQLSPEMRYWHAVRLADASFARRDYASAAAGYSALAEAGAVDPLPGIRHAFALSMSGRRAAGRSALESVIADDLPKPLAALGGLLLARAQRENRALEEAVKVASAVPAILPDSDTAALAALEAMESQRLLGRKHLALPEGAGDLIAAGATTPARGLLAYRVAAAPNPGDEGLDAVRRLGSLLATLPTTRIQLVAQNDLTQRLSTELAVYVRDGAVPDAEVLDTAERFLRPQRISENALLLAVEGLAAADRRGTCVRWARTLAARERRPLRRGLAAWREVRCLGLRDGDRAAAHRLMIHADSGSAGPFALALAALAAESQLRLGDPQRAVRTYERALQAFTEPSLLGPVVLRLGEIEVVTKHFKLARARLTSGLALTDAAALATDPFRKAGILALAELSAQTGDYEQLRALLRVERKRVDPWWDSAYAYLLNKVGDKTEPEPESSFALVLDELEEIDRMNRRVDRVIRSRAARARALAAVRRDVSSPPVPQ